jgi:hypothetical protein
VKMPKLVVTVDVSKLKETKLALREAAKEIRRLRKLLKARK